MLDRLFDDYAGLAYSVGVGLILSAAELGRQIGCARQRKHLNSMSAELGAIEAAALGLFALMMGFTFSMAVNRYDNRLRQVVAEANAIGTTALRAEFLPPPHSTEVVGILREYVNLRMSLQAETVDQHSIDRAIAQSTRLQAGLWAHAKELMAADPQSLAVALFVQSSNELIDLQTLRIAAYRNHVPNVVVLLLYVIAMVALGYSGYAAGLEGKQGRIPHSIMAILVGSVIWITVDIDRPRSGLLTTSQVPIEQSLDILNRP